MCLFGVTVCPCTCQRVFTLVLCSGLIAACVAQPSRLWTSAQLDGIGSGKPGDSSNPLFLGADLVVVFFGIGLCIYNHADSSLSQLQDRFGFWQSQSI